MNVVSASQLASPAQQAASDPHNTPAHASSAKLTQNGNGAKPKPDWRAIRYEYETTAISQRQLAKKSAVSQSTLMKRAMREGWKQRAKLARLTINKLEAEIDRRANAKAIDELTPFIEEHKAKITKLGVEMSNKGTSRINTLWDKLKPNSAKAEAEAARALETLIRVGRTSLGMNDGSSVTGPLSVNILANHAAIQVNNPPA